MQWTSSWVVTASVAITVVYFIAFEFQDAAAETHRKELVSRNDAAESLPPESL